MKLSAEQFAQLASTFNAKPSPQIHERRRAARMDLAAKATITPIIAGKRLEPIPMTICDFSARGIALLDANPMDVRQQFVLELPRREGAPAAFLCTVMHVKPLGSEMYRIGAEFTCGLQSSMSGTDGANESKDESNNVEEVNRIRTSVLE